MKSDMNNHGQNHGCKGSNHKYKMILYQGIINFKIRFHDKFYIVSMGMNTKFKVDSYFSDAQLFIHFSPSKKL